MSRADELARRLVRLYRHMDPFLLECMRRPEEDLDELTTRIADHLHDPDDLDDFIAQLRQHLTSVLNEPEDADELDSLLQDLNQYRSSLSAHRARESEPDVSEEAAELRNSVYRFLRREYGEDYPRFGSGDKIGLIDTGTDDTVFAIRVYADPEHLTLETWVDGKLYDTRHFSSAADFAETLAWSTIDDLIDVDLTEMPFIRSYYVTETGSCGDVHVRQCYDLESALQMYRQASDHTEKKLGVRANSVPARTKDFLRGVRGHDYLLTDHRTDTAWWNPEIFALTDRIRQALPGCILPSRRREQVR